MAVGSKESSWLQVLEGSLSLAKNTYGLSNDGVYTAVPTNTGDIDIIVRDGDSKVELLLTLKGHRRAVDSLCFSHSSEPVLLVSAASDYIIRWNMTECHINHHNGLGVKGQVVMQSPAVSVKCISWSYNGDILALCAGCSIFITTVEGGDVKHELNGHGDNVTCAEFCPHYESTLVSASSDRTYVIWNVETGDILYRSAIISSSSFLHLVMDDNHRQFLLISADAMVRFYDITSGCDFSQLTSVDVDKILRSTPSVTDEESSSYSSCVLTSQFISMSLHADEHLADGDEHVTAHHVMRSLFGTIDLLLVVTSSHFIIINTKSVEVVAVKSLTDCGLGSVASAILRPTLFTDDEENAQWVVYCLTEEFIGRKLKMSIMDPMKLYYSACFLPDSTQSVISVSSLAKKSPLLSSLVPKTPSKPLASRRKPGAKPKLSMVKKKGGVVDQPIVHHSKVKSSGYATTHSKVKMFQPQTKKKPSSSLTTSTKPQALAVKVYPCNAEPISKLKGEIITIDTKPTQIMGMHFSTNGQNLALACTNQHAYNFKLPLSNRRCTVYSGHTEPVNSCKWSHGSQYVITAGGNGGIIWSKDNDSAILKIDSLHGNLSDCKAQPLPGVTRQAQFYYLDKFILISSAEFLLLYKYHLELAKNDLKRYENSSKYRLVVRMKMDSAQSITSLSAVNTFYSHLVLATGSDRSIQVFDMNRSTQSRVIEDCHTKPAHHIVQNEGSMYSSLPYSAYDLFMTSAVGDGVKLWDLRSQSCVRKYESHTNRVFPCTSDFSPDGRYIASGSENKMFYIYDIGSGKVVSSIKGPADVSTHVLYHPFYPQIAVGSLQGTVAFYES